MGPPPRSNRKRSQLSYRWRYSTPPCWMSRSDYRHWFPSREERKDRGEFTVIKNKRTRNKSKRCPQCCNDGVPGFQWHCKYCRTWMCPSCANLHWCRWDICQQWTDFFYEYSMDGKQWIWMPSSTASWMSACSITFRRRQCVKEIERNHRPASRWS